MKKFLASSDKGLKGLLWILAGVSTVGFILGCFALLDSVFGIISGEAKQVPFIDHLWFTLMSLAPVLSGSVSLSAFILLGFWIYKKKR